MTVSLPDRSIGTLGGRTPRCSVVNSTGALDHITHAAGEALDMSAVFASMVNSAGHLVTSSYGMPTPVAMLLAYTLRKQVIASARPFVESDARSNTQLMRCPVVRDGAIRACVAMPLGKAKGGVVGTLLAVDRKAREWLVPQLDFLEKLSILIVSVVELRAAVTVSLNNESTGISSSPMVSPVRTLLFS